MNLVRHLKAALAASESPVEPLAMSWKVFTGIETAADAYTQRIRRKLPPAIRRAVEANGATVGEPIMELPRDYAERTPWNKHRDVLALSPEPTAILYGALDTDDAVYYLQLLRDSTPPQEVLDALERWKPLLGNRAEIRRNASRKWWETAWPRDPGELAAPKVIALYRTNRGRFALDESGTWKPGKKCTVVVGREPGSPVAYLCGLLNSEHWTCGTRSGAKRHGMTAATMNRFA
jgi:hypothetical protein